MLPRPMLQRLKPLCPTFPLSLALLAASLLLASPSRAQSVPVCASSTITDAQIDSTVQNLMDAERIPGLSIGIYCDGKILKARGYGLANVELSVPASEHTIYQTGSVGKQFTATAIMILVEEHKIALDDAISKYLATPAAWHGVTVRYLLTHTSGIADYTENADKPNGLINLRHDYTEDQLFAKLIQLPLKFQPGEKWSYSNTNYVLLGFIIHKITGEFYGDFLQQRIFKPLSMDSTRIISERDIVPNRSAGYEIINGQLKNQYWVSPSLNTTADGALYTNVVDLSRWDAALYTEKIVKKSSLDQMWTPARLNSGKHAEYGFGWEVPAPQNGHHLVEHDGAWQGFTMAICRYLDDRLTIVVMTNLDAANSNPSKLAHSLASLYLH